MAHPEQRFHSGLPEQQHPDGTPPAARQPEGQQPQEPGHAPVTPAQTEPSATDVFVARPGTARPDLAHLPPQERKRIFNREAAKRWRAAHPDEKKAHNRSYYEQHQEQRQTDARDYYQRNRETILARRREKRQAQHPVASPTPPDQA